MKINVLSARSVFHLRSWPRSLEILVMFAALFFGAVRGHSQTMVQVDSTKPWQGYMNIYNLSSGSQGDYIYGSPWELPDLRGFFTDATYLTLTPCSNVFNITDSFWTNPDGTPNKWMEASFYVDVGTDFQGQTVTFNGSTLTNTLVSPYSSVAVIKEFAPGYAFVGQTTAALIPGEPFTVTRTIGAGNIAQYGFVTTGPDANPTNFADLGQVVIAVNNQDPSLSGLAGQALVEGQTAHFTIAAQGTTPLTYQWAHVTATSSNVLADDTRISGATTDSLTIANVTPADAGKYYVTVANSAGSGVASANLSVIPFAQAATNLLINPGFEEPFTTSATAGWIGFNGAVEQSTNDFYYFSSTHVSVLEGTNAVQIYSVGADSYNGVYQDRPALPGQVYTANCWFLTPAEDQITGANVCYLEVQFRDANDATLVQYSSAQVTNTFPTATWFNLSPTNIHAGDFVTSLGTAPYLIAPPGTAKARFQVTYHGADGFGSVYIDGASFQLREPVATAARNGNTVELSFPTLYGPSYQVYYKTNLTEQNWHTLGEAISGDGTVKTVSDTAAEGARFYSVNTK